MALAAYIFIQGVSITNDNIKALVVAANLLCLLGQEPQNISLINASQLFALTYNTDDESSAANDATKAASNANDAYYAYYDANDDAANAYAEEHFDGKDWYVLDARGRNINGGDQA